MHSRITRTDLSAFLIWKPTDNNNSKNSIILTTMLVIMNSDNNKARSSNRYVWSKFVLAKCCYC